MYGSPRTGNNPAPRAKDMKKSVDLRGGIHYILWFMSNFKPTPCRFHRNHQGYPDCKWCKNYVGFKKNEARKKKRAGKALKNERIRKEISTERGRERVSGTQSCSTKGFVYLVTNAAWPGWVKVGSAVDFAKRLKTYQTADPNRGYVMEYVVPVTDRRKAEHTVLSNLTGFEIRNEWIRASIGQIKPLVGNLLKELAA